MPRGPRTTIVAVFIAAAVAVPSAQAEGGFFGLDYSAKTLGAKPARKLDKSGARTVRWTFFWPRIETRQGSFDWSAADKLVGRLAAKGIRVLPTLYGSPRWVTGSHNKPPLGSTRARLAWKRFVRAAVERYGPGGKYWAGGYRPAHPGKAMRPIRTWQIWNEPNLKSHWKPHPSAREYGRLLKLSDRAIEDADRRAKVMFAGMPGYSNDINAWSFLKRVYRKRGAERAFNVAAIHPYARNVKQMLGEVKRFRKVMRKHGDRRKPLSITEIGWGSAPPNRSGLTKGKKGQARTLKHAFRALRKKRHRWHIKRALWFNFHDPRGGGQGCSFCSSAGLLKANLDAKPSWSAFRSFTR